jgi:hypothetical protein
MMGQERGTAIVQGLDNLIRQLLSAEGGVRCAPDIVATGHGDHVMEGRDGPLQTGKHRTIGTMGMEDTSGLGIMMVDIAMHAPFGGRLALLHLVLGLTGEVQPDDIRRGAMLVRQGGRRDQKAIAAADAQIAGGGLIETQLVHGPGGCQQLFAAGPHWPGSSALRVKPEQPFAAGRADAPLGHQAGHQGRGGDVKGGIQSRRDAAGAIETTRTSPPASRP